MNPRYPPPMVNIVKHQTCIIGAGLTGLIIAHRLDHEGVVIIEKSRGVGGRMATRRSDKAKFDHGAQFYTLQPAIEPLHTHWMKNSLVSPWFDAKGISHYKCATGMTTLAKDLAQNLTVKFETRVARISKNGSGWLSTCDNGEEFEADRIVLTAPLPQSLELLRTSAIAYDQSLDKLIYAKAIVGLVEATVDNDRLAGAQGYRELEKGDVFSIANQKAKGLSATPAWTVTLKPEISEDLYEKSDLDLRAVILEEFKKIDPNFEPTIIQIKKWRYSHPLHRATALYYSPAPNFYLAGDAFGGGSLNGAARSANAVADHLSQSENANG